MSDEIVIKNGTLTFSKDSNGRFEVRMPLSLLESDKPTNRELELSAAADLCDEHGMEYAARLLRGLNLTQPDVGFRKWLEAPTTRPASGESIME